MFQCENTVKVYKGALNRFHGVSKVKIIITIKIISEFVAKLHHFTRTSKWSNSRYIGFITYYIIYRRITEISTIHKTCAINFLAAFPDRV